MKKLTVLLAAVMAFAFSATAYAATPSDLAEQPVKVQDAFAKTMALGIINGYEDGTVGPEQNITRAEFAKIAVTAAGAKDTAEMLANNSSSFKDVKAGQWYTGWVNASESLGIFQGDGNGNFRPNDTITNQEVITVLMRLLGYNDNLTGTWPVNYVTQANKIEILDDVAVVAAQAAKRADVVVMLDATLDSNLVTYDKDTDEFVNKQTTKAGSQTDTISLLADSFKGTFVDVTGYTNLDTQGNVVSSSKVKTFSAVSQVKDAEKRQLTWNVGGMTLIIDDETRVSYNGGSLFDLAGHQGKVYYVKENDKLYARFIEVESYTETTTKKATAWAFGDDKVKMEKTSYNAASIVDITTDATAGNKNSNYVMYFNEDDQVYAVKSDRDFVNWDATPAEDNGRVSFVKKVNKTSVKLVGAIADDTINFDDDVLVYTEDGFITAEDLKVGDAVKYIADDLFVKVDPVSATLTGSKKSSGNITEVTIGGKSLKTATKADTTTIADAIDFVDEEFNKADAEISDIYGNEVKYILNRDNSIAVVVVDAVSTGTKLYGIVMGGDGGNGFGNGTTGKSVSIFTEEGKTVNYYFDTDCTKIDSGTGILGQLIEYKLNSDGDIKSWKSQAKTDSSNSAHADVVDLGASQIEVVNNSYLKGTKTVNLASNVVVFEVDNDGEDVDATIATRASVLAQDDFTPKSVYKNDSGSSSDLLVNAYAYGFKNTNGALRAFAYTNAANTTYYYGVVAADPEETADFDSALVLVDDETTYEAKGLTVNKGDFIVYTKSGDKATVIWKAAKKVANMNGATQAIAGAVIDDYTDGIMTLKTQPTGYAFTAAQKDPILNGTNAAIAATSLSSVIMTDDETIVYVMDTNGEYVLGSVEDISDDDKVYVLVVDEDTYADVMIVDNYNR